MNELLNLSIEEMVGLNYNCSCGCFHNVGIENIVIGTGVLDDLLVVLKKFIGKKVFILEDKNTYKAAGNKVECLLVKDFQVNKYIFNEDHLMPDEKALGRLLVEIPGDASIIIAVGSGSINDIARFLSYKLHIPYAIVCTAPSMDGYASVVSPLIVDGVKTTYNAIYPYAIVADIDILKKAPMYMLHAGLGDIIGKYTALADWNIARIIKNEYFCANVQELMLRVIHKCVEASFNIEKRDCETIKGMTEALILSGLAIGMVGSSRPASGEEHHLSHCWEMIFMDRGISTKWLHGNNVGVGVGVIIEAYRYLSKLDINKIYKKGEYKTFDMASWMENLNEVYGRSAKNVIEFKRCDINFNEEEREKRMKNILDNWDNIKIICDEFLPEPNGVRNILKSAGAITNPEELGIDKDLFIKSFIAAKDIRKRYGILQLLEDIGELRKAGETISKIYYK